MMAHCLFKLHAPLSFQTIQGHETNAEMVVGYWQMCELQVTEERVTVWMS